MYDFSSLVKRHILIFLRDKTAVFFSFLSVIILLVLYFLFIGRQFVSGEQMALLDEDLKTYLVTSVMMGGVIIINTVSLSLGMMGNFINDLEHNRLDGFLVTPVKRYKIILSYYLSSIIVTATLTLIMWFFTISYVGFISGYWYPFETIVTASLLIIFFTFFSSTLMIYLTTLLKSINAFGTLSGVLGTFIGFVTGIYIPLAVLGQSMVYVASLIPFTHMTILLRSVLLSEPYQIMGQNIPSEQMEVIESFFGTREIGVLGMDVSMYVIMAVSTLIGVLLLYLSFRNITKKIKK